MSGADIMCRGYCELVLRDQCQGRILEGLRHLAGVAGGTPAECDQEDHQPHLTADMRRSLKFHPSIIHVERFNCQTGRELGTVITCLMEENK